MRNDFSIEYAIPKSGFTGLNPCFWKINSGLKLSKAILSGFLIFIFLFSGTLSVYGQETSIVDEDITSSPVQESSDDPVPEIIPKVSSEPVVELNIEEIIPSPLPVIETSFEEGLDLAPESTKEAQITPPPSVVPEPNTVALPGEGASISSTSSDNNSIDTQEGENIDDDQVSMPIVNYYGIGSDTSGENIRQKMFEEILKELNVSSIQDLKNKLEIAEKNIAIEPSFLKESQASSLSDDVYSAKDGSGDKEIYLKIGNDTTQITNNNQEDDFVSIDPGKKFLAWQSLVEGRWQIFYYDIGKKLEERVTDADFNNINPSIGIDLAVWQGWVGDNWEIFIARKNIDRDKQAWDIKQITDNYYHDMFPKVAGNIVAWQAFYMGRWHIFAYDLTNEKIWQVSEGDEANENPRFVIIWDSKNKEGAVKTIAYDIIGGRVIPIDPSGSKEKSSDTKPSLPLTENNMPMVNIQPGTNISSKSNDDNNDSGTDI